MRVYLACTKLLCLLSYGTFPTSVGIKHCPEPLRTWPQISLSACLVSQGNGHHITTKLTLNLTLYSTAFRNLSSSEKVNAVLSRTINVYAYDAKSLLGSHGAAVGASLILIIIGLWSFYSNGTAHDIRFSSIVAATRSQDLDRISDRHSQELQKASKEKLIYGIADDVHIGNGKLTQKLSFGSKEKVIRLRKRQVF